MRGTVAKAIRREARTFAADPWRNRILTQLSKRYWKTIPRNFRSLENLKKLVATVARASGY